MKKLISAILASAILSAGLAAHAAPVLEAEVENADEIVAKMECDTEAETAADTGVTDFSWNLSDDGTLTISGHGRMPDYESSSLTPWYDYTDSIKQVIIQN